MQEASGIARLKAFVDQRLLSIREQDRWRHLETLSSESCAALDFTHNDYLGLRQDESFQRTALQAAQFWPCGAGASRLLGGEQGIYQALEADFADWKGSEAALFFTSGYAANEAVMNALAIEDSCFFSDALNHASLIDGMRLARLDREQRQIFRHNDTSQLEELLQASTAARKWIITESLFSMDGDFAPLQELAALADRYQALLVIDEAHALGVVGPSGQGYLAELGLSHSNVISINPCGKAMGVSGACVAGPAWFRDYLINTARGFIFSTGASPWIAAALQQSVAYVKTLGARRKELAGSASTLRQNLSLIGYDLGSSNSHIIPVLLGSEARALKAEQWLRQRGIRVKAIRPPTVATESCRLRLSLHSSTSSDSLQKVSQAFEQLYAELF